MAIDFKEALDEARAQLNVKRFKEFESRIEDYLERDDFAGAIDAAHILRDLCSEAPECIGNDYVTGILASLFNHGRFDEAIELMEYIQDTAWIVEGYIDGKECFPDEVQRRISDEISMFVKENESDGQFGKNIAFYEDMLKAGYVNSNLDRAADETVAAAEVSDDGSGKHLPEISIREGAAIIDDFLAEREVAEERHRPRSAAEIIDFYANGMKGG